MPLTERTLELTIGLFSKQKGKLAIWGRTPGQVLVPVDCLIESKGLILGEQVWGKARSGITLSQLYLAAFLRAAQREMARLNLGLKVDGHTLCVEHMLAQLEW